MKKFLNYFDSRYLYSGVLLAMLFFINDSNYNIILLLKKISEISKSMNLYEATIILISLYTIGIFIGVISFIFFDIPFSLLSKYEEDRGLVMH